MLMLHKKRARKPVAYSLTPNIGLHPNGVGGIEGHAPVVSLQIAEYTLYITQDHFENIVRDAQKLITETN